MSVYFRSFVGVFIAVLLVGFGAVAANAQSLDENGDGADQEVTQRPINFEPDSLLDVGSQGQQVRWVQQLLAQHPDIYPEGLVTGYFGNSTSQAVSRLQRQADLPAVGRVGSQTLDYLQQISDPIGGGENPRNPTITLTDTYRNTFDFTAEITRLDNNTWEYDVQGAVPSPGYSLEVMNDGATLIAMISRSDGPAQDRVVQVQEGGEFSFDGGEGEVLNFEVRGADQGGQNPTARLQLTDVERPVDTSEQFTVDAGQSSDPDGDDLQYQFSVSYDYEDEARPDVSGSGEFTDVSSLSGSIGDPGIANFQVTVRDEDGNTDTASLEFEIGETAEPSENQPPTAQLSLQRVTHTLSNDYRVRSGNHDSLIAVLDGLRGVSVVEPEYDRGEIGLNVSRNPSGLFQTIAQEVRGEVQEPGDNIGELTRVGDNEVEVGERFIVDASNSSDPDDSDDDLEYQWEVEAPSGQTGGGSYQDDPVKSGSFNSSGTATFEVTVRDEDGGTDTATLEFQVGEADGPGDGPTGRYDDQMILERTVGGIEEFPVTIGDVNEDGEVTADDASFLADYINGEVNLDTQQRAAADVDGSGQINGRDVNKITEEVNDPTSSPRFPVIIGDVDGNLSITAGDAGLVQDYVRGEADLSTQQLAAADVNGDGEVTADVDDPGRQNQPPQAEDDSYSITAGEAIQVSEGEGFLANDSDPDGDELEVTNINRISNYPGVTFDPAGGDFYLRVDEDYQGEQVRFRYEVTDGELTDTAVVQVDVRDNNAEGEQVTLTDKFKGVDNYKFTATITDLGDNTWQYEVQGSVPSPNYEMTVDRDGQLLIAALKENSGAAPAVVSDVSERGEFREDVEIEDFEFEVQDRTQRDQPGNRPPQAEDDSYSITAGNAIEVSEAEGLLANDSDPNGDSLEVTNINQQSNYRGVNLEPSPSGAFELSAETPYEGEEAVFRYTVSDGELEDSANIDINVRDAVGGAPGGDQEPTAELSVTPSTNVDPGQQFRVDASGSSDPNGDTLEYRWSIDTPRGSGRGSFGDRSGLQVALDTPGTATFFVTVRDNDGNTDSESVEVVIGGDEDSDLSDAQLILDRTVGEIDEFPADEIIIGDVDQNGSITAGDADLIKEYVQGDAELNFRQKAAADVDGDGEITADDSQGGFDPVEPPVDQPVLPGPDPEDPGDNEEGPREDDDNGDEEDEVVANADNYEINRGEILVPDPNELVEDLLQNDVTDNAEISIEESEDPSDEDGVWFDLDGGSFFMAVGESYQDDEISFEYQLVSEDTGEVEDTAEVTFDVLDSESGSLGRPEIEIEEFEAFRPEDGFGFGPKDVELDWSAKAAECTGESDPESSVFNGEVGHLGATWTGWITSEATFTLTCTGADQTVSETVTVPPYDENANYPLD